MNSSMIRINPSGIIDVWQEIITGREPMDIFTSGILYYMKTGDINYSQRQIIEMAEKITVWLPIALIELRIGLSATKRNICMLEFVSLVSIVATIQTFFSLPVRGTGSSEPKVKHSVSSGVVSSQTSYHPVVSFGGVL